VAQIGTFGSMMARGAVRDVARALGYAYGVGDKISRIIPMGSQGFPMTIDKALETSEELADLYKSDADTKRIIDLAKKIEGNARHISVHAAGVVIAPGPLLDYTPIQFDPRGGKLITQYDMYAVGEDGVGLTKFDFLGLRNLSILASAIGLIKKIHNLDIDLDNIPLDDKKTFAMLARGETTGLFQLNGSGMTKSLKELRPNSIHDINAMVALYRPGPLQFIPEYIKRKHNPHLVSFPDPALKEILGPTYGILVYQDDLLMMAHNLAGYSWGEVDKFRACLLLQLNEYL
jgi:DNA polymerase-3 subunit alpha